MKTIYAVLSNAFMVFTIAYLALCALWVITWFIGALGIADPVLGLMKIGAAGMVGLALILTPMRHALGLSLS